MGREVKRVSLDFDWYETHCKKDKKFSDTWQGYLFDLNIVCFLCHGKGTNIKGKECPLCLGMKSINPTFEPPKDYDEKNNGYQLWQNVSEGSPVSPVFKKAEDLAKWLVENDDTETKGTTYQAWLKMIKEEGSCPTGIMSSQDGVKSGMALYEKKVKR